MHSSLEAFEQIAEMFFPGASWTNFTMVSSVERELGKICTHCGILGSMFSGG